MSDSFSVFDDVMTQIDYSREEGESSSESYSSEAKTAKSSKKRERLIDEESDDIPKPPTKKRKIVVSVKDDTQKKVSKPSQKTVIKKQIISIWNECHPTKEAKRTIYVFTLEQLYNTFQLTPYYGSSNSVQSFNMFNSIFADWLKNERRTILKARGDDSPVNDKYPKVLVNLPKMSGEDQMIAASALIFIEKYCSDPNGCYSPNILAFRDCTEPVKRDVISILNQRGINTTPLEKFVTVPGFIKTMKANADEYNRNGVSFVGHFYSTDILKM